MNRARVLLADDHKIVSEGLRSLLEPEFELIRIVEDGRALVKAARELQPDVIVVDISLPLLNGIEAVRQLTKNKSRAKVVFLTMHSDVTYAARAFEAGATGFVLKHSAASELITAIREALLGRTYVTPQIAGQWMQSSEKGFDHQQDPIQTLTPRQREVLQLLAEGRSAAEAATILHLSRRTVEFHKYRLMDRLGIHTNAELIQYAIKHGIVSA